MQIAIVIPAHNEADYIGPCIESVIRHGAGRFNEIVVVDNASTDGTGEVAARFPGVRVVREDRKGLTRARQTGLEATTAEFVAYMDGDSRLDASWFQKAESLIARYPEAVSWSGPVYYYDAPSRAWNLTLGLGWWLTAPLMYRLVGYMVLGGNFMVRRSAVLEIGGFDPNISFYGEDMTLARRLSKVGTTIFRMQFFGLTSARRFIKEGYLRTNMHYVMNYTWPVLFGRPYHREYTDVR
ncbi:MAG: glycosyltransferase family 2 protein [Candidatus Pacebacteria bacterium]|nr:glycosyltransferase family 2 protein [Candidatus Paceibacterota bacterium]